jgi:acetyl-CoA carboxylase biotin carboxylase subunit
MISKLAAWGRTRAEAIDRLRRALDEYAVGGIKTTLPFFREIVRDREFIEGRLDTGFIPRFLERRSSSPESLDDAQETVLRDLALVAAAIEFSAKKQSPIANQPNIEQSKWRLTGRDALHESRT